MAKSDWGGAPAKAGAIVAGVFWVILWAGGWDPWGEPLGNILSLIAAIGIGWFIGAMVDDYTG